MRRPHGYMVSSGGDGSPFEADTAMCPHCNAHFVIPRNATAAQLGQFCTNCMAQCCTKPSCNTGCAHFMKALEASEARDRLRRSLGVSP